MFGTLHIAYSITLFMMTTGASCIGEYLEKSCILKALHMSKNPIGDVGISQILQGLHHNTTLTKLNVMRCQLSEKGKSVIVLRNTGVSDLSDIYTFTLGPYHEKWFIVGIMKVWGNTTK